MKKNSTFSALLCTLGVGLACKFGFNAADLFSLGFGLFVLILYLGVEHTPYDKRNFVKKCLWVMASWGFVCAILEHIVLRNKPFHVWQSSIWRAVPLILCIIAVFGISTMWEQVPGEQKKKMNAFSDKMAKKMRGRSKDPNLYKYLHEQEDTRQQYWNHLNAGISFVENRNDPVFLTIMKQAREADDAYVTAVNEIQYAAKKDIDGWIKQINSSVRTIGISTQQIDFYLDKLEEQKRLEAIERLKNMNRQQYSNGNAENGNGQQTSSSTGGGNNSDSDAAGFDFFAGCKTPEEFKKRYRELMKSFHPDSEAGDAESVKIINAAYDKVRKEHGF